MIFSLNWFLDKQFLHFLSLDHVKKASSWARLFARCLFLARPFWSCWRRLRPYGDLKEKHDEHSSPKERGEGLKIEISSAFSAIPVLPVVVLFFMSALELVWQWFFKISRVLSRRIILARWEIATITFYWRYRWRASLRNLNLRCELYLFMFRELNRAQTRQMRQLVKIN